jgi:hypothetical protein
MLKNFSLNTIKLYFKVNCTVDYIQPKIDDYPEKVCCTVMMGET